MEQKDRSGLRSAEIANGRLTLVLNNSLAAVEDGRRAMKRFLGPLDPMAQNRLEVVFEEIVSNTVRHGFRENSGQTIRVRVDLKPSAIELTFEDDGKPFNPMDANMPGPAGIETARVGGLGIPLIVKLSSGLRYERLSSGEREGFSPNNRTIVSIAI